MFPGERGIKKVSEWPEELRGRQGLLRFARLAERGIVDADGNWDFSRADLNDMMTLDMLQEVGLLGGEALRKWGEDLTRRIREAEDKSTG